jgi:hypothetical protein
VKHALIFAALGYAVLQTILLIYAAAARLNPAFEPEVERSPKIEGRTSERELELV